MTIKEFAEKLKKISRSCLGGYLVCETDLDYLISQAEQERTNFEKYKDELTVEKASNCIEGLGLIAGCHSCPLDETDYCSAWKTMSTECKRDFLEWANKRCEE